MTEFNYYFLYGKNLEEKSWFCFKDEWNEWKKIMQIKFSNIKTRF